MIDSSFFCFMMITLGCVYISLRIKYVLNLCRQVFVKIYDQTFFWAFNLFYWIPTALCKCFHLPFHLFIIIFYLQNKAALYSNVLLKLNPCGEEMWNNAVELVKEMCLKHYTVYMCEWLMLMCVFPAAKSRGCNVSAIKACCCCWRTQALLPAVTDIRCGF